MASMQEIFQAAGEGRVEDLHSLLLGLSPELHEEVLHPSTLKPLPGPSLLSTAAHCGHLNVVELLVEHFNVDPNQLLPAELLCKRRMSSATSDSHGAGDVVSWAKPAALSWKFDRNHLEVLRYLVGKGAQLDYDDDDDDEMIGFACIKADCYLGSAEIVAYLWKKRVIINKERESKHMAVHTTMQSSASQVVKNLLEHRATMSINSDCHSLLIRPAMNSTIEVLNCFIQSLLVTRQDKINALELLGAVVVRDDSDEAFGHLRRAMVLRQLDPCDVISKPHSPLPTLSNVYESCSLNELDARRFNPHLLRLECLAVVQRHLGCGSFYAHQCGLHSWELRDAGRFRESASVMLHSLKVPQGSCLSPGEYLKRLECIAMSFSDMAWSGQPPCVSFIQEVLEAILERFQLCESARSPGFELLQKLPNKCFNFLIFGVRMAQSQEEKEELLEQGRSLIHLKPSLPNGGSVLHFLVTVYQNMIPLPDKEGDLYVDEFLPFVLRCGADVNAGDNDGNRPLHLVAGTRPGYQGGLDFMQLKRLIETLVEAGTPVNVLNREGKTPQDVTATEEVKGIFQRFYPLSLQSLAAAAVAKHKVPFAGRVPEIIEDFIQRHGGAPT